MSGSPSDKNVKRDIPLPFNLHLSLKVHLTSESAAQPVLLGSPIYFTFIVFITTVINYLCDWPFSVSPSRLWALQGSHLSCLLLCPATPEPGLWMLRKYLRSDSEPVRIELELRSGHV